MTDIFGMATDFLALPLETLIASKTLEYGTTVTLRIAGGNRVQVHGKPGQQWTAVLAEAMALAAHEREAHP